MLSLSVKACMPHTADQCSSFAFNVRALSWTDQTGEGEGGVRVGRWDMECRGANLVSQPTAFCANQKDYVSQTAAVVAKPAAFLSEWSSTVLSS